MPGLRVLPLMMHCATDSVFEAHLVLEPEYHMEAAQEGGPSSGERKRGDHPLCFGSGR